MPLFSIIIPTFNARDKLEATLNSVRAQNADYEIWVQDGGSTDGTREFLSEQTDVSWASERDRGIYDAMNRALRATRGRFALFLGAGDLLCEEVLERVAALPDLHPRLLLYGKVWLEAEAREYGTKFSLCDIARRNVPHQGAFYGREVFDLVGDYSLAYPVLADHELNLRAFCSRAVETRFLPLVVARYEGGGVSVTRRDERFERDWPRLVWTRAGAWPFVCWQLHARCSTEQLRPLRALRAFVSRRPQERGGKHPAEARSGRVSVVVPTFNRGSKIKATLDSALRQTHLPFEVIVVDDGSTDGTGAWVEAHYGEGVRLLRQPNGGVARARNRGLREARGEFIAFLDHDDQWLPHKLERQLAAFENAPNVGLVYCAWDDVDEAGALLAPADARRWKPKFGFPTGRVFDVLVRGNFLVSASVPLVRTALLRAVGGFDPRTAPCDDWDAWLALARCCEFARVEETLVRYAHHEGQQSRDEERMWRAEGHALQKHLGAVVTKPTVFWRIAAHRAFLRTLRWYHPARAAVGRGDWNAVRRELRACLVHRPLIILVPQWWYIGKRLLSRDARPF